MELGISGHSIAYPGSFTR